VVLLALGVTEGLLWRPGVTDANLRCLQLGMTLAEVEGILGRPADEQTVGASGGAGGWENFEVHCWRGPRMQVRVEFWLASDGVSRVALLSCRANTLGLPMEVEGGGFLPRLRALLGR